MPKVLLVGDTHVYKHKQIITRQEDCLKCLRWSVDAARKNKIKYFIHLGDIFHDKIRIYTLLYQQVYQIFKEASDIEFTLLLGNHDMWYMDGNRGDVSSIRPFGALPNVNVVCSPETLNFDGISIDFVPYSHDPTSQISHFKKKSRVMLGHLAVDNAVLNIVKNTRSEVEIESDADMIPVTTGFFKGWEKVFLGHYHGAQIIDGFVEYVGSNLQLTWNETGQQKHIIILDLDTLEKEYIVNDFSPIHLTVTPEEAKQVNLSNNFVRIQIDSIDKADVVALKAEIISNYQNIPGPLEIDFIEKKKPVEETATAQQQSKFNIATGDTIKRFIEATGTAGLEDPNLLEEIGRNIASGEL